MRLSHRILAITLMIAVVALIGLSWLIEVRVSNMLRDQALTRIADSVKRETRVLENSLDLLKGDVIVLAQTEAVDVLSVNPAAPADRQRLAQSFAGMMQHRPAYTQIRYVGVAEGGREVVRVNRSDGRLEVVPDDQLQSKGDRYYLREVLDRPRGSIYVSPVDLNREHGEIARPYQPVFRVGTPVVAPDGRAVGAIIINLDFDAFLGDVMAPSADLRLFITNVDGDYLLHPDGTKRFGFEFGRRHRLPDDMGLTGRWTEIIAQAPVSRYLVAPRAGIVLDRVALGDGGGADERSGHFLVVAAVASMAQLETQAGAIRDDVALGAALIGLLLAMALAYATARLTRPIGALTKAADRIAAGEHGVPLAVKRNDEVGKLAKALSRMVVSMHEGAKSEEMASMGRMASMVAHDLRNALSSVKMNLQIIGRRHIAPDDAATAHCRIALDQVLYMEHILSDMLTFARGDHLKCEAVDIGDVVSTAIVAELAGIEEKDIRITLENIKGHPLLHGDRTKLVQVFQNLVNNAVQACGQGGVVAITGMWSAQADRLEISVQDNGGGVPPDIAGRVFEPFFTTRTKGTGLGLAIVRRIIHQHDGTVTLESMENGGCRAWVSLPVAAPLINPDVLLTAKDQQAHAGA